MTGESVYAYRQAKPRREESMITTNHQTGRKPAVAVGFSDLVGAGLQ